MSCCNERENAYFLLSVKYALLPLRDMNLLRRELKADRMVEASDCLSLLCGILV